MNNNQSFYNALGNYKRDELMRNALKRAEDLIGATDFKEFMRRSASFYEYARDCDEVILAAASRMYLLSANDGDGVRTQINILSDMLRAVADIDELGIQYFTLKVPDPSLRPTDVDLKTDRDIVLADIEDMGLLRIDKRRLCCIDITRWIDRVESAEFRAVISRLRDRMYDQFVVFWIPAVDEITLRRVKESIEWYVNVDEIYTAPLSVDEYYEYGLRRLKNLDCRLDEGALEIFRDSIVASRTDKLFWGFYSVRNLVDEMIYTALMEGADGDV